MKAAVLISMFVTMTLLSACDKETEKEESASKFTEITAPFLTASDFAQGSEDQTSADDISAKLLDADELWDNHPDAGSGSSTMCMENFKVRSVGANKVSIGGSDNLTACLQELYGVSVTLSNVTAKYYIEVECAGVDLTGMDGMAVTDQNMATLVATCGQAAVTTLMQSETTMLGSASYMGQTYPIDSQFKSATMNSDGTGCVDTFSGGDWTSPTCTIYNKIVSNSSGQTATTLIAMGFNNRVQTEASTAPFYKSGTVDLYINGWDGTVTYNGPNSNADFTITHGADTITGQLTTDGGVMTPAFNPMALKLQNGVPSLKKLFSLKLN